jgi:hypothetical protein
MQIRFWRGLNTRFHAVLLVAGMLGSSVALPSTENSTEMEKPPEKNWVERNFGMNYNSFFYGPGLGLPLDLPPGMTGAPADTGLNFFNLVSVKWKFSERFALDVQFRNQLVVTNQWEFRHQGQRFGISGTLLKGEDWSLTGAVNSDVPIRAILGQIPSERTLLVNPGMFATFNYAPKGSAWSLFALLAPRFWLYTDREAVAIQDVANGGTRNKPEYSIYVNPSVNYALNEKVGFRLGTTIEYRKNIGWESGRRNFMPMEVGVTYALSPKFNIYTYLLTSTPLDDSLRRAQLKTDNPPSWTQTASINVWLSGTIF